MFDNLLTYQTFYRLAYNCLFANHTFWCGISIQNYYLFIDLQSGFDNIANITELDY